MLELNGLPNDFQTENYPQLWLHFPDWNTLSLSGSCVAEVSWRRPFVQFEEVEEECSLRIMKNIVFGGGEKSGIFLAKVKTSNLLSEDFHPSCTSTYCTTKLSVLLLLLLPSSVYPCSQLSVLLLLRCLKRRERGENTHYHANQRPWISSVSV